jgi:hypothetical protein
MDECRKSNSIKTATSPANIIELTIYDIRGKKKLK